MFRLKTFAEGGDHYIVFAIKEPSDESYPYLWKATTRIICYKVSQVLYTALKTHRCAVLFFSKIPVSSLGYVLPERTSI